MALENLKSLTAPSPEQLMQRQGIYSGHFNPLLGKVIFCHVSFPIVFLSISEINIQISEYMFYSQFLQNLTFPLRHIATNIENVYSK